MHHIALIALFFSFLCLHSSNAVQLPSSFKKCSRKQANFTQCLATAVTDAFRQLKKPFPEIGLPSLEPLSVPSVTIPAGKSALLFEQKYKNFSTYGLSSGEVLKIDVNFEKKTIYLEIAYPEVVSKFEYDYDGYLFLVPVRGSGPGSMAGKNVKFLITFSLEEYDKQGKNYFRVTNTKLVLEQPELIVYNFENLARNDVPPSGDDLSPNQIFNQNWVKIFHDINDGYENFLAVGYGALFNSLLGRVSISELFGDE